MKIKNYFFVFILALVAFIPGSVGAQELLPACAVGSGNCTSCDFVLLFVNLSELISRWISAVAVITFVFGGLLWLISGGNSERIERGKSVMVGSIIGIALVLGGYTIVNFAIAAFIGVPPTDVKIFGDKDWNKYCTNFGPSTPPPNNEKFETPAPAIVSDCTSQEDSTACSTAQCTGSSCVCHEEQCMTLCEVSGFSCVATEAECTGDPNFGSVRTTEGDCQSVAPVCCVKGEAPNEEGGEE